MSPPISCLWWTLGVNYTLIVQMSPFFQGSETNVPTYFLSVLNTGRLWFEDKSSHSHTHRCTQCQSSVTLGLGMVASYSIGLPVNIEKYERESFFLSSFRVHSLSLRRGVRGPPMLWSLLWRHSCCFLGGGPRVVVSTAAFHARVRGSVPGLGGLKETKLFLPHPRVKVSIVGSLRDREVACSASDRQGSNFESCVWRTVSSQSSHHPQEVLLAQFSLYVHKGGLKPDSFHFLLFPGTFH